MPKCPDCGSERVITQLNGDLECEACGHFGPVSEFIPSGNYYISIWVTDKELEDSMLKKVLEEANKQGHKLEQKHLNTFL